MLIYNVIFTNMEAKENTLFKIILVIAKILISPLLWPIYLSGFFTTISGNEKSIGSRVAFFIVYITYAIITLVWGVSFITNTFNFNSQIPNTDTYTLGNTKYDLTFTKNGDMTVVQTSDIYYSYGKYFYVYFPKIDELNFDGNTLVSQNITVTNVQFTPEDPMSLDQYKLKKGFKFKPYVEKQIYHNSNFAIKSPFNSLFYDYDVYTVDSNAWYLDKDNDRTDIFFKGNVKVVLNYTVVHPFYRDNSGNLNFYFRIFQNDTKNTSGKVDININDPYNFLTSQEIKKSNNFIFGNINSSTINSYDTGTGFAITSRAQNLNISETINTTFSDQINLLLQNWHILLPLILIGFITLFIILSPKVKKTNVEVPIYTIPDDLSPALTGLIYDQRISQKEMLATFLELRRKNIVGYDNDKQLITRLDYSVDELTNFEKRFLHTIFKSDVRITQKEMKKRLTDRLVYMDLQEVLINEAVKKNYFSFRSVSDYSFQISFNLMILYAILTFFMTFGLKFNIVFHVLAIVSFVYLYLFLRFINYRTQKGVDTYEKIRGFKLFLDYVENDRINMFDKTALNEDSYEKYLPYAIVLGLQERWERKFGNKFKINDNNTLIFFQQIFSPKK